MQGLPPPWTHDPVLAAYKFTNAYRASDRVSQHLIRSVIWLAQGRQRECFMAVGVTFPALPSLELQPIDVQNLFCEIDKYARVAYPQFTGTDGRHRIKQRFQASVAMLPLWYPPKWGINDKLGAPTG